MDKESITRLSHIVADYMDNRDLTVRDFAKKAGVSSSHVQNIKTGNFSDLQISTLTKIAHAMSLDLLGLAVRIGLVHMPYDFFSANGLSNNVLDPHKDILDKHADILIRITEKIAHSGISPKQVEKIVDIVSEIKHGNR